MAKKEEELEEFDAEFEDDEESAEESDEIMHLVRVMNTDLIGSRQVQYALTGIRGIGIRVSKIIAKSAGIEPTAVIGYLSEEEVARLEQELLNYEKIAPVWMINRQRDLTTGENKHLLGTDIMMTFKEDINNLKKVRAYRGLRHERGLKVRGQRTKSTGRRGPIVGVKKKKA